MPLKILVTGASIAGNAAAYWLSRSGHDVTIVERADAFREGGQNIDVRGAGREVLQKMGLEGAALEQGTGEEGTAWIGEQGETVAEFLTADMTGDGPAAEMEILRGDLAKLLFDATRDQADYRFADHVTEVSQSGDGVSVTFRSGRADRFDILVVAEGVGSATREIVFPRQNNPRWMDLTTAHFTIPRKPDDDRLWRWYHSTAGRSVSFRPDRHGTTRAMLSVQKSPEGEQDWDEERQKAWLSEQFRDAGWQAPRVLAAMDTTDDFYFDVLRQVRMPSWTSGRVVLTGDAAWCVTPIGGIGATLALTGAYVLAGELERQTDLAAALAAYEAAMRPMVEEAQGMPKIVPRMMNPHSRLGLHLLHGALKLASLPALRYAPAKIFARPSQEPDLSRYDTMSRSGDGGEGEVRQPDQP
jgi:2-polyprenyl-6-methoxyphenol hydroxylase-like FAD-dependent oxidoreductase